MASIAKLYEKITRKNRKGSVTSSRSSGSLPSPLPSPLSSPLSSPSRPTSASFGFPTSPTPTSPTSPSPAKSSPSPRMSRSDSASKQLKNDIKQISSDIEVMRNFLAGNVSNIKLTSLELWKEVCEIITLCLTQTDLFHEKCIPIIVDYWEPILLAPSSISPPSPTSPSSSSSFSFPSSLDADAAARTVGLNTVPGIQALFKQESLGLVTQSRYHIKTSKYMKINEQKGTFCVYLFNDLILIAKLSSGGDAVKVREIPITGQLKVVESVRFSDPEHTKKAFEILGMPSTLTLIAENETDKLDWVAQITSCIDQAMKAKSLHRSPSQSERPSYQIIEELGSGAGGTVFLVQEKKSQAFYAIKMKLCDSQRLLELLQKETDKLMKFKDQPNICQIHKSFVIDQKTGTGINFLKQFYVLMKYYDGGDLNKRIEEAKKRGSLTGKGPKEDELLVIKWMLELLNGIVAIHDRKMIHRDLKPANLLLDQDGQLHIGDFGIAIDTTLAYSFVGTRGYYAPEVWSGTSYGSSVDMWSAGCILLDLLTLTSPVEGEGRIRKIPSHYSTRWSELVTSLLTQDRVRPSAVELGVEILEILDSLVTPSSSLQPIKFAKLYETWVTRKQRFESMLPRSASQLQRSEIPRTYENLDVYNLLSPFGPVFLQYYDLFIDKGFDAPPSLALLTIETLKASGVKEGHAPVIYNAISRPEPKKERN